MLLNLIIAISKTTGFSRPTIVAVQGAFQAGDSYQELHRSLQLRGYSTVHPTLPTCSNVDDTDFPQRTIQDDAIAVRSEIERLVLMEQKEVVVVMHSYGGLVGSEAVTEELTRAHREQKGLPGGVTRLFYIAAFIMDVGETVIGRFGDPTIGNVIFPDGRYVIKTDLMRERVYHDLSAEERDYWMARLQPQPYIVLEGRSTQTAWKYTPSTYLICDADRILPAEYQELFARFIGAEATHLNASHIPHLTHVEALVDKITASIHERPKALHINAVSRHDSVLSGSSSEVAVKL